MSTSRFSCLSIVFLFTLTSCDTGEAPPEPSARSFGGVTADGVLGVTLTLTTEREAVSGFGTLSTFGHVFNVTATGTRDGSAVAFTLAGHEAPMLHFSGTASADARRIAGWIEGGDLADGALVLREGGRGEGASGSAEGAYIGAMPGAPDVVLEFRLEENGERLKGIKEGSTLRYELACDGIRATRSLEFTGGYGTQDGTSLFVTGTLDSGHEVAFEGTVQPFTGDLVGNTTGTRPGCLEASPELFEFDGVRLEKR